MFSVGRFDPSLEVSNTTTITSTTSSNDVINNNNNTQNQKDDTHEEENNDNISKKRNITEMDVDSQSAQSVEVEMKNVINNNGNDGNNGNNDDGTSSSSCPSSSDESSSSAPSSDSEDEEDENEDNKTPTPAFQVIAPKQEEHSIDKMRKKLKTTNEGMDDFDHDNDTMNQNQSIQHLNEEVKRAIQMSNLTIQEASKIWNLAPFLVRNLERDEYDSFFPIQALVIPDVLSSERHAHIRNRDVCVSSPTGSGKTLSFVIPVLNSLAGRKIRRLRALIVLPSRDLGT
jgi:ATP-dependent RNA helicase DDX51/DBP6